LNLPNFKVLFFPYLAISVGFESGSRLREIGWRTFDESGLGNLILPSSVEAIEPGTVRISRENNNRSGRDERRLMMIRNEDNENQVKE
jgi:hypothetical protein